MEDSLAGGGVSLTPYCNSEQKVLYPGEVYPFGRGSDVLNMRAPTISAEQGTITVAKHPLSDAVRAISQMGAKVQERADFCHFSPTLTPYLL